MKFREEYKKLSEKEKGKIGLADNFSSVNLVESIWIQNGRLNTNLQFHFFYIESETDLKIDIDLIDSPNYLVKLGNKLDNAKWNKKLSEPVRKPGFEAETYADLMKSIFFNGVHLYEGFIRSLIFKEVFEYPQIRMKQIIDKDMFCWVCLGKIQELKVEELISPIILNAKSPVIPSKDTTENIDNIKKGFGTYFYPPIWIGEMPELSLEDKISDNPSIMYKKFCHLIYKDKVVIVGNDGFIGIQARSRYTALKLLNEIMATAVFLNIPAFRINESELGEIEIDLNKKSISSMRMNINSMRTNLIREVQDVPFWRIKSYRNNITKEELFNIFSTAEKLTIDSDYKNFLLYYLESITMYQNASFPQSFILSWLIIELYLSRYWDNDIIKNFSGKRKENLESGGSLWSAYHFIEVLNMLDELPDDYYEIFMKLKRKRDKIVHQGEECSEKEALKCLEMAAKIFKNGLKPDNHLEIIYELLINTLDNNGIDFEKIIDEFGQVDAAKKRDKGHKFSFEEHLKALIFSMLSNRRQWSGIVGKIPQIDKIFLNYDPVNLEKTDTESLLEQVKDIKCGNISIDKQIKALPHNIQQLRKIEKDFGSLDEFVTHDSAANIAKLLSDNKSEYKIKQMGPALALEYLKSVGIRGIKPDVHILRICGPERLGIIPLKDTEKQLKAFKKFAETVNVSETYLDNLIWIFGATGYAEICTSDPKCHKCELTSYCNQG